MHILIYGAGAVGNYLGAHLALAGHQVTLLGRERMASSIANDGLILRQAKSDKRISTIRAVSSLDDALGNQSYDWIAFTMKAYDTVEAIHELQSRISSPPPIVSFQNGVGNEESLQSAFGKDRIVAGTVTTPVLMSGNNIVVEEKKRGVAIASDSPHSRLIECLLKDTDLKVDVIPNSADLKWSKLLLNMIANATCAILDMSPAEALKDSRVFRIEVLALQEALAMMELQKINVVNLPGTPAKLLAAALRSLPMTILRPILYRQVVGGRGDKMPSLLAGLRAGRTKTEVSWLNGAVALAATNMQRLTPINHSLALLLTDIASGRVAWSTYQRRPDVLVASIRIAEGMLQ